MNGRNPTNVAEIPLRMLGIFHEVACRGCSCRKCLPPTICSSYNEATKSTCTMAATLARCMASTSDDLAPFRYCHVLKCLHSGNHTNRYGFCSRSFLRASARFSGMLKSQGSPSSGSTTAMPKGNPSTTCLGAELSAQLGDPGRRIDLGDDFPR